MKNRFVIIGMGGVGTQLVSPLCRYLNFHKTLNMNTDVVFVDGDEYETRNEQRQDFIKLGNKATIKYKEFKFKFPNLNFITIEEYLTNDNISEIIQENDYVFVCVDNHKTRKIISDYCESHINNINIISGGNEYTDGNVQIYIKKDGIDKTPSLTKYHPEIENPDDKLPTEMSCQELSVHEPQLLFTNLGVAFYMCCALYNVLNNDLKYSETYFDISILSASGKIRS